MKECRMCETTGRLVDCYEELTKKAIIYYYNLVVIKCFLHNIAMMSGDLPPAYLVFTTGNGFAPNIEGIPQAMKGLGTMFMLALLTGENL